MLTQKQHDLLLFINEYTQRTGLSPSFEEMKHGLDLKSKSGIHRLINALVERGFLERLPNKARALEVKKLPENMAQPKAAPQPAARPDPKAGVKPNFKQKHLNSMGAPRTQPQYDDTTGGSYSGGAANVNEIISLPMYGKIAAGTPIEALRHEQDTIDMPMHMLGGQGCYALTIEGDSMMKAGIMDGDIVIIEKCDRANDGDIVVALVDDAEVTLKRLRREIGSIVLMPENDAYQPLRLPPNRVQIQGRLRSLFRNY
ncbi:MAG TPA: transcriptional repressor LexA [Alphaproteobacteria bacterium]|jgi:repressor LexA|nr:transcriptional repressor LexA [Alphaproteobacteria bacterium]